MNNLYANRVVKEELPNTDDKELLYGENVQPVDPFYSQSFVMGENGVYLNEIERTRRAESVEVQNQILSQLRDFRINNPNTKLDDSQIIERIVPRNVQNFAEVNSYIKDNLKKVDWQTLYENSRPKRSDSQSSTEVTTSVE